MPGWSDLADGFIISRRQACRTARSGVHFLINGSGLGSGHGEGLIGRRSNLPDSDRTRRKRVEFVGRKRTLRVGEGGGPHQQTHR